MEKNINGLVDKQLASLLASRRYVKELRSPMAIGPGIKGKVRYIGIPSAVPGIGFDRQRRGDRGNVIAIITIKGISMYVSFVYSYMSSRVCL